jgi:hypothetical protein
MIYFTILISIIIFIWAILHFGNKPKIHRKIPQNNLKKYLEVLLNRGYDRSFIIIQVPWDKKFKRFLQYTKYIGDNNVGLEFDYPLAEWSKPYYDKLKSILQKSHIGFEIEKTDQKEVPEFLVIDIKKDLEMASKISILVLQDMYNLGPNDFVELYFYNISPREERIGF